MDTPSSASPPSATPQKRSLAWLWWLIGIIVTLVIGMIFLLVMLFASIGKGASDVADLFFDNMRNGQTQEAYDLTNEEFQSVTSYDAFRQFINSYPVVRNVESLSFNSKSVKNDVATLRGTLTTTSGEKQTIEIIAVKEGERWYIQSIDLNPDAETEEEPGSSNIEFDY